MGWGVNIKKIFIVLLSGIIFINYMFHNREALAYRISYINSNAIALSNSSYLLDKLILVSPNLTNNKKVRNIKKNLNSINPDILEGLINSGIKIKLVDHPITQEIEYNYLKGIVPKGWEKTGKTWDDVPGIGGKPVIIRIGYSDFGNGHGSVNLELHETAHAIDKYVLYNISSRDEFENLWKGEVNKLFPNNKYFINSSGEYFAETFAMYYLNKKTRDKLQKKAPLTYQYIKNLKYGDFKSSLIYKNI